MHIQSLRTHDGSKKHNQRCMCTWAKPHKHAGRDEYLFFWRKSKDWMIGPDYDKDRSGVASNNDGSEADAHLVPAGRWKELKSYRDFAGFTDKGYPMYNNAQHWRENAAIRVECAVKGDVRASFDASARASATPVLMAFEASLRNSLLPLVPLIDVRMPLSFALPVHSVIFEFSNYQVNVNHNDHRCTVLRQRSRQSSGRGACIRRAAQ